MFLLCRLPVLKIYFLLFFYILHSQIIYALSLSSPTPKTLNLIYLRFSVCFSVVYSIELYAIDSLLVTYIQISNKI